MVHAFVSGLQPNYILAFNQESNLVQFEIGSFLFNYWALYIFFKNSLENFWAYNYRHIYVFSF